ncbi:MAG TPA: DUF3488 and transglutaminase-like domain-containing protein [Burkholderiaceae bacterium]|nr:DUF3488 and transglutaminase-like domain-containing protein [Burkholderiaceae bacterium]
MSATSRWTQTWRHWPRDTRDTLFLLANIAWVTILMAGQLPWWCTALTSVVLLWRGHCAWRNTHLPSRWWLVLLVALTAGATLLTHRTLLGQEAGITLIVALLALKTLELRAKRDAFVVFFLGLFTLLTHFLHSQSLLTAAGVLLAVWGLLTSLVLSHMPVGKPPLWVAARTAGGMALLGAPIMVVLFLLFPRIAPLWGVPADGTTGRTGLSSNMQVGNVASLAEDRSIAFRLRFDGEPPHPSQMYFRGPVLGQFDGREWRMNPPRLGEVFSTADPNRRPGNLSVQGEPIDYEVTLEPSKQPWVMVLDVTPQQPRLAEHNLLQTPDLQWLSSKPLRELTRYRASSHLSFRHGPDTVTAAIREQTSLPAGFNPRTLALAQQWRSEAGSGADADSRLVQRALQHLQTGGYGYTLSPGAYGTHTADEFWFDRKLGFCEHIASAFVILMRGAGVPARVVTGYQGGERNPVDGYVTVRQSDAHAWAEVWLPQLGWQRVDPTSSVAPSRTESTARLNPVQGAVGNMLATFNPALLNTLRNNWEALNNRWNQWVLSYSQGSQMDLLKKIGFDTPSWTELGYVLAGLISLATLGGAAWAWWERQQHDPWLRLLERARARARQAGLAADPTTTPRQLADRLRAALPEAQRASSETVHWLLALEALRYANPQALAAADGKQQTGPAPNNRPPGLRELAQRFVRLSWPQANSSHPRTAPD